MDIVFNGHTLSGKFWFRPHYNLFPELKCAELPVDTASLACFLIGKTLVRDAPEGRTRRRRLWLDHGF